LQPAAGGQSDQPQGAAAPQFDVKQVLAKNSYRAGKDLYAKGDYAKAQRLLQEAQKLAPGSVEGQNAGRLSSNIGMMQGKLQLNTSSEKASGAVVRSEVSERNRQDQERQSSLIDKGLKAAREGREDEARDSLVAAMQLNGELLSRGADQADQRARLQPVAEELKRLEQHGKSQIQALRMKLQELKGEGKYKEALELADRQQSVVAQARESNRFGRWDGDEDAQGLQRELDELAVAAAK